MEQAYPTGQIFDAPTVHGQISFLGHFDSPFGRCHFEDVARIAGNMRIERGSYSTSLVQPALPLFDFRWRGEGLVGFFDVLLLPTSAFHGA